MSGIAGIANLDGSPIERGLLLRMMDYLTPRGPDAQRLWIEGHVGFCHTLLRTVDDVRRDCQPLSIDGKVWIAADARIDARSDLSAKLRAKGQSVSADAPDAELILRAYHVWEEKCVEQLLGDFAFCIWDATKQRLFCARDHAGVKPLYYWHHRGSVIISNSLDCIRLSPAVADELNDAAIGDFLLFDLNQDKGTTVFAEIERVPPAHCITWTGDGMTARRYWSLPIDDPVYYRRRDDYVDHFVELLDAAVEDRLRTSKAAVFMSGGLDSPTLAATATRLLKVKSNESGVRAFTSTFEGYDEERHYAGLVAEKLGIPIEFRSDIDRLADDDWEDTRFHTPEPMPYPNSLAFDSEHAQRIARHSRVAFFGEGPDNALRYEWKPHLTYLARRKRYGRLISDLFIDAIAHRRLPLPRIAVLKGPRGRVDSPYPDWLNPTFERNAQLRERWAKIMAAPRTVHPFRPSSYASFDLPLWQAVFEGFDFAYTQAQMEVRHPFADIRVMRYLLAVPALPWGRGKYLLRKSMEGVLPVAVLTRPKSPLVRDPWVERVIRTRMRPIVPEPELGRYILPDRVAAPEGKARHRFWIDFRARSLNYWLKNRQLL